MRATRSARLSILATAVLVLGACGAPGSGGGEADPTSSGTSGKPVCDPVAGEQLVVLEDDGGLQNADNIIPAVNAGVAQQSPAVVELLDSVSASLDTEKLIGLNKAVDIDRRTSSEVAKEYVEEEGLAADDASAGAGTSLVVGAANFSESVTLAEIYGEVLRSAGYQVEVRTIGNRDTYLPALVDGTLSTVPEYAATLADFLNASVNGPDAPSVSTDDVDETVAALTPLAEQSGLVVGAPSAAQDQNAFAVTQAFADEHDVTTLSDLAEACGGLVLAGPPECPERPFCQPGLEETYGLEIAEFKSYDFGLIGAAVRQGDAAIGLVLSSDGSLATE
ncbi:glycine betaine ABC transporter substrate-binding protein [Cellulomonas fimi]|uniref:Substrate-binding region of ABC-type glycine betaine transport system n=1 Tax=Cellulomonas fimi (strain ATCC 484 / DSM 20113 / JCM 1341 / CCUG 24087 / LMG 16345 / NBRC 15513 / NCIMB 8980 / NCTC 7547 / NRS-133) TaxID=590998 RepID=F4H5Q7_CELFA|nr:glycine betaine ABC transporter substrate-binding protein [Cellulomonas fimi]AEE45507.1 Substrate-binding region of ABC-type glycine betaine transport system [Cellulomonas fimi ATCC 484]NNH07267.1 glycine/betaine ABC transporter substrate-binding protein [Cellulomonas fimi]VEH29659.1 Substrate binding domain of ABC-type glycine betaine transport system [Cellulomonas fimi]